MKESDERDPHDERQEEHRAATEEELAETGVLASLTSRWSAMIHAPQYDYDTFVDEVHQIGAFVQEQQAAD